jgi:hypothetical protein
MQTSIEWLRNELVNNENIRWRGTNINVLIEQAKEMNKKEMIHFANDFWNWAKGGDFDTSDAEQYYQETFKK